MNAPTYTPVAKGLHWLMAALILGLAALGIVMHEMPLSPLKLELYAWHKWFGVTVFLLVWLRLAWRLTHRPPAPPATLSAPLQSLAHAGHALLYVLMIVIPLSGWLMSSAKGVQTVWFGLVPCPTCWAATASSATCCSRRTSCSTCCCCSRWPATCSRRCGTTSS